MGADIDGQGIRVRAGAGGEHRAHLVDADRHAGRFTPALEKVAAFAIGIRQGLTIVAAGNAGTDLRHIHQHVPETVAVDAQVLARCCHHFKIPYLFMLCRSAANLFVPMGLVRR
ncbi:hypothetical protein D3C73_508620 [compost metagenome]